MIFHYAIRAMYGCAVLAGVMLGGAAAVHAEDGRHLMLGRITEEPGRNIDRLNAMGQYLAATLAPDGISSVEIVIAETPEKMKDMLRDGRVDLFSETAFVAFELMDERLAEPLMREWKKGVPEYHSVIIARRESGVRSLSDLVGRKIAFEDAGSTSGYLLPRAALEAAGLTLSKLDNPRSAVPEGMTGYSFAKGEINVVTWVNRGLADAGAISNLDWENPEKAPERLRSDLTIIHETVPVVRSLMMVRRTLDEKLKERLASVLEHMHETPEGQAVLKSYFKVSRYDPIRGETAVGIETARDLWRHAGVRSE